MTKAKVLFISSNRLTSVGGGSARSYQVWRALREHFDVEHLDLSAHREPPVKTRDALVATFLPLRKGGSKLMQLQAKYAFSLAGSAAHSSFIKGLAYHIMAGVTLLYGAALQSFRLPPTEAIDRLAFLRQQLAATQPRPDIALVWLECSWLLPALRHLRKRYPNARVVCNAHNIESNVYRTMVHTLPRAWQRAWCRQEARRHFDVEVRGFRDVDAVITCSLPEAEWVASRCPGTPALVLANGVDVGYFTPGSAAASRNREVVLFTGTMAYQPNRDAVAFFLSEHWNLIRAKRPNAEFWIVGRQAGESLTNWHRLANVKVFPDVSDIRPYFDIADVVVVPLRAGGGTRIKILEAAAMQKAIVSTRLGSEGLELTNEEDILIRDDRDSFVKAVTDLLDDNARRSRLGANARNAVVTRYQWASITAEAIAKVRSALSV